MTTSAYQHETTEQKFAAKLPLGKTTAIRRSYRPQANPGPMTASATMGEAARGFTGVASVMGGRTGVTASAGGQDGAGCLRARGAACRGAAAGRTGRAARSRAGTAG
jgi:hypothetical protein